MPNVYMDAVPVVQTIGAGGIGVQPPVPIEKVEKISGNVREQQEITSPAGRLPNPVGLDDGRAMEVKEDAWREGGYGGIPNPANAPDGFVLSTQDGKYVIADSSVQTDVAGLVADPYDPNGTYSVGDPVVYNNTLYRCVVAIPSAEAWTPAHWVEKNMAEIEAEDISALRDEIEHVLSPSSWQGIVRTIRAGGTVPNGTEFSVPHSVYGDVDFITRRMNVDKVYGDENAPTVTIQAKYLLSSNGGSSAATFQFDRKEAMFPPLEEAIPSGTVVKFTSVAYGQWTAGDWHFTASVDLPVGTVFCLNKEQNTALTSTSVEAYADQKSTSAFATMPLASGDGDATVDLGAWVTDGNHPQRISYGSNNDAQSCLFQWLNAVTGSNAVSSVWTPKTPFDMMGSSLNSLKGFLGGFPEEFQNALKPCLIHNVTNTVFETGGYSVSDEYTYVGKFWLPSRKEIYGSNETTKENSEVQFPYYAEIGTTDADKLMYAKNAASPASYWLRTPYASGAYAVRICNATNGGALSNRYAVDSYGVAPLAILA